MTVRTTRCPPKAVKKASALPSPPSATGSDTTCAWGSTRRIPASMDAQTWAEVMVPLKESGTSTNFFMANPSVCAK